MFPLLDPLPMALQYTLFGSTGLQVALTCSKWSQTSVNTLPALLPASSAMQANPGNRKRLLNTLWPGPWYNIKMSSYLYRKSHCGDKTVVRSSYLHNGFSYTGKMSSSYWIRALVMPYVRRQTITWINAVLMSTEALGINFSEIWLQKNSNFHSTKCIWKYHLWNNHHFVSTSIN